MESICTYLPASILSSLVTQAQTDKKLLEGKICPDDLPTFTQYESVVLFADVSGFTMMCEALASQPNGNELLAKHLNSYFEMLVRIMSSQGGDVFKFAGDAIIVLWPPSPEDLTSKVRRAAQCAVDISDNLQEARMAEGVRLSVKVGIGVGNITILNVGGLINRLEYLAIGDPLAQAFHAEHHATKREVVVSPEAWKLVEEYFEAEVTDDGHAFLRTCKTPIRKVNIHKTTDVKGINQHVINRAISYVSPAIVESCSRNEDRWISESRRITVLFVNLGVGESELINLKTQKDFRYVHEIIKRVQESVYRYEGSLNKFLMDDKGSTLIAVFGLPPCCHEDDAMRGVLAAIDIANSLAQFGLRASVGVTTGDAFCGVIGARGRREYSVLGDIVNLSARLMQYATVHGTGVLVSSVAKEIAQEQVSRQSWYRLKFFSIGEIKVKGKSQPIQIYKPSLQINDKNNCISLKSLVKVLPEFMVKQALSNEDAVNKNDDNDNKESKQQDDNDKLKKLDAYICVDHSLRGLSSQFHILTQYILAYNTNPNEGKGTVFIEANWGLGKTHLLYSTLLHCKVNKTLPECTIIAAGNGFTTRVKEHYFEVWRQVIVQLIKIHDDIHTDSRMYIRNMLLDDELKLMIPCLNDALHLNFEETVDTLALSDDERIEKCILIIINMIKVWSSMKPILITIDDGMFLDMHSWEVVHQLHQAKLPILMIIASRPMNDANMVAFCPEVPSAYYNFAKCQDIMWIILQPWDTNNILNLSARAFGTYIRKKHIYPAQIGQMLLAKSCGNPKVALEFVNIAKEQLVEIIVTDKGRNVEITPLVPLLLSSTTSMIPLYCMGVLGSILDRIPRMELHILKTAALIIGHISGKIITASYPVSKSSNEDFEKSFKNLVDLNILVEVEFDATTMLDGKGGMESIKEEGEEEWCNRTYSFRDGYMSDVVRSRMQATTIEKLQEAIVKNGGVITIEDDGDDGYDSADEDDEETLTKVYAKSIMEGWLQKVGGTIQTWKNRYCILFSDKLLYFATLDDAKRMRAKGEIPLSSLSTCEWDGSKGFTENMFLVSPTQAGARTYRFKAEERVDGERWLQKINKNVIQGEGQAKSNSISEKNRKSAMTSYGGRGPKMSATFTDSELSGLIGDRTSNMLGVVESGKVFEESVCEGWMLKTGGNVQSWKKRYFIMFPDKILYFRSDTETTKALGEISLSSDSVCEFTPSSSKTGGGWVLRPTLGARDYRFITKDEHDVQIWFQKIKSAVAVLAKRKEKKEGKIAAHSIKEGFLRKRGGALGRWQTRYFIFFSNQLHWFHNRGDLNAAGECTLYKNSIIRKADTKRAMFIKPTPISKSYTIGGKDDAEIDAWIKALQTQAALQKEYSG